MNCEYIPGPLAALDDTAFMDSYTAMGKRAVLTLAQAVERRYDLIEEKLAMLPSQTEEAQELKEEKSNIEKGEQPQGPKGSALRRSFFENWKLPAPSAPSGFGGGSEMALMQHLLQQRGGMMPQDDEMGRKVRLSATVDRLRSAVDGHNALQWDERMAALAGEEGVVKQDDESDGTSQVRFTNVGMVAWVPTETLQDLA